MDFFFFVLPLADALLRLSGLEGGCEPGRDDARDVEEGVREGGRDEGSGVDSLDGEVGAGLVGSL